MAFQMPPRVERLTAYAPHEGDYTLRLDANESAFPLGERLERVLARAVSGADLRRYPDPRAEELCRAAADFFGVKADQVAAGCGSDELIMLLINAFAGGVGPVLVSEPDFSMYRFYSEIFDIRCVSMNKAGTAADMDGLIQAAREQKAAVVIFSNPCNPTGGGVPKAEVLRLIRSTDALVIVDEAYMDFWNESILDEVAAFDNAIVLKTCSKAIGLAGVRVGFAIGQKSLVDAVKKVKSPYNVSTLSQAAATALLREKDELLRRRAALVAGTRMLEAGLKALAARFPQWLTAWDTCANFVYCPSPRAKALWDGLRKQGILVRHMGGALRICTGTEEENRRVLTALEKLLEEMA